MTPPRCWRCLDCRRRATWIVLAEAFTEPPQAVATEADHLAAGWSGRSNIDDPIRALHADS